MVIQDDTREVELLDLFQLERPHDAGRAGTDVILRLKAQLIPFELKSTTRGSVTTVRDFGPEHVEKWKDKHRTNYILHRSFCDTPICVYPIGYRF